jgi:16S rRNA (adenine1518-N6/adenine1519-N6)-dimethyltransferase
MYNKIKPIKRYGQNFLINPQIGNRIVDSLGIQSGDIIVEIGSGLGSLTQLLKCKPFKKLILLETDLRFIKVLKEKYHNDIIVKQTSIIDFEFQELFSIYGQKVKVIGNIPYNITSGIIFKLLENNEFISRAILLVQKEVAIRILAQPNCKDYGTLSIMVQSKAHINKLFNVSSNNFYPVPKVDSSVINLEFRSDIDDIIDYDLFSKIIHSCFQMRRKMLRNSLTQLLNKNQLAKIKCIKLTLRPEELSIQDFKNLSNEISQTADL